MILPRPVPHLGYLPQSKRWSQLYPDV